MVRGTFRAAGYASQDRGQTLLGRTCGCFFAAGQPADSMPAARAVAAVVVVCLVAPCRWLGPSLYGDDGHGVVDCRIDGSFSLSNVGFPEG